MLNEFFIGSTGAGASAIDRSINFDRDSSTYLWKGVTSGGNRRTWTWSGWVKRSGNNIIETVFSAGAGTASALNNIDVFFYNDNASSYGSQLVVGDGNGAYLRTNEKFKDFNNWGHLVVTVDTTLSQAEDRIKLYWNGSRLLNWSENTLSSRIPQNAELGYHVANIHTIGSRWYNNGFSQWFNGYIADVHSLDGIAVGPEAFAVLDGKNAWQPVEYTGEYGLKGYHLTFADNSSPTALGLDSSGNNNNYEAQNLSVENGSYFTLNNLKSGSAENLTNGVLYYLDTNYQPVNGAYIDTDISIYGFSVGQIIRVRYWNAAHAGGQTCKATFTQHDINGNVIGDTAEQTWSAGEKWNSNGNWRPHTLQGGFHSIRVTLSNNSFDGIPWGIGEMEIEGVPLVAGSISNSVTDTPTTGNYATINPIASASNIPLSQGNLIAGEPSTSGHAWAKSSIGVKSGKWYAEFRVESASGISSVGLTSFPSAHTGWLGASGSEADQFNIIYNNTSTRQIFDGNVAVSNSIPGTQWTVGDILQIAYDADNKKAWFGINNTWYNASGATISVADVESGNNATFVNFNYSSEYFFTTDCHDAGFFYNFGQRPFEYDVPSGFEELRTTALDDSVVPDGSVNFDVQTYDSETPEKTLTGFNFSPDLVWVKSRFSSSENVLVDTVRGATLSIFADKPDDETVESEGVKSFTNDGFVLGDNNNINSPGNRYVTYAWDAGESTVSNNDGSISAQVRANPATGFSVVKYTGTGGAETVGHGLNDAPSMIFVKDTSSFGNWKVLHSGASFNGDPYYQNVTYLNDTVGLPGSGNSHPWNGTAPTSSVFSVSSVLDVNMSASTSGVDYIAYCWTAIDGYSAFGSFVGNGETAPGLFIYTGFKPRWIMVKTIQAFGPWAICDTERGISYVLAANSINPEDFSSTAFISVVSNGFLLGSKGDVNTAGDKYIYTAFAESPFANSRATAFSAS